ncbi:hypothetical protein C7N77_14150 [Aeromonas rivipollensis]|nr:hypothetical protein C7N77_14150 [Aeromonas rivipollensis]
MSCRSISYHTLQVGLFIIELIERGCSRCKRSSSLGNSSGISLGSSSLLFFDGLLQLSLGDRSCERFISCINQSLWRDTLLKLSSKGSYFSQLLR